MTMIDQKAPPTKLLWVDMEMTGLDVENDVILEIAAVVTDFDFNTLATYESIVGQPKDYVTDRLMKDAWWAQYPENRDELISKMDSAKPKEEVEQELIALVEEHFGSEPAVIAGNSIHNDRNFMNKAWPMLNAKLHYRMLDVSAFKVLMQGKYGVELEKRGIHRAVDDIQDSIDELKHYLEYFKNGSQDS